MKHILAWLALIFCAGIFFSVRVSFPFALAYPAALFLFVFALLAVKKKSAPDIFLCGAVFFLGLAVSSNSQILPRNHIYRYIYRRYEPYLVKGYVADEPLVKNQRISFVLRAEELQLNGRKYNCSGKILVYLKGKKRIYYADELILSGNIYRPFGRAGGKRTSYRDYLANRGIFFIMNVKTATAVVKLNKNRSFPLKKLALCLKNKTEEIIFKYVPRVPAAIMDAMVLGEKKDIPAPVYNSMIKSGTVHILVVSGFNVGIVGFIIVLFLKLLRIRRKIRLCLAAFCLVIYCLATGGSTPVVRATVMAVFFILAYLVKREPDIYNALGVAAIVILLINPRQLCDIGFQLSFASVIAIVFLYPKIKRFLRIGALKPAPLGFLLDGCAVSFSAWLGTAGIIAANFRIFSPVTVLANIFIVPLAALITLCSFSLALAGAVAPALAPYFALSAELAVALLLGANSLLIRLPAAYFHLP